MDTQKVRIVKKEAMTPDHKCTHAPYEYYKYEITKRTANSPTYVAIYEIPPQKSNYPYHYHVKNEEVFYIISGIGTLETPEGDQRVTAGDVIVCPTGAQGAHKLTNASDSEKLVYIDFDVTHSPEVVYYPHTNKMGVIVQGESSTFFNRESAVGYYEGEKDC